jgi:uncharacterized Ntn-hydrolase superfamily protein
MRDQLPSIAKHVRLKSPRLLALVLFAVVALPSAAHATWSVVAVDPVTGDVGVAGASCFPGVAVIASVVPGKGVVVAQGLTSDDGRDYASRMLREGSPAKAIVRMIRSSKVDNSFIAVRHLRQYGVASLHSGEASVASFTGAFTGGTRGSREAAGVSVQGNVLVSLKVLDNTLASYVSTPKSCGMAVALLNALEAGAREGGDKRCPAGQTALSAFLIVARPGDGADAPTIRLISPDQKKGESNPVLMLREQLRSRYSEMSITPDDCTF